MFDITVNGVEHQVDVIPEMPLLWVLRDELGITSPKYGCGIAECGACTVQIDGAGRSFLPGAHGRRRGQGDKHDRRGRRRASVTRRRRHGSRIRFRSAATARRAEIIQAISPLETHPTPTDEDINEVMSGNLSQCGTYERIRVAIDSAAEKIGGE